YLLQHRFEGEVISLDKHCTGSWGGGSMAEVEKVGSDMDQALPLRITRRKARRTGPRRVISARVRVRCGCCNEALEIHHDHDPTGNIHCDSLEINGVSGTVGQWREVLLPLLGMKVPKK
ncbi:MAG: hypothetical protein Q7S02_00500, partial [bacterium]|nr:hypothetical protein [bacterium]